MPINELYYGERGIVRSIIDDIRNSPERVVGFLNSIAYLNSKKHPRFTTLDNHAKDEIRLNTLTYLIEGTFGQWGTPDLMIVINSGEPTQLVYIIEAKVNSFADATIEIPDAAQYIYTSDNSSMLNIQLALRYRFMNCWLNPDYNKRVRIREPRRDFDEKYDSGRARKFPK